MSAVVFVVAVFKAIKVDKVLPDRGWSQDSKTGRTVVLRYGGKTKPDEPFDFPAMPYKEDGTLKMLIG